MKDNIFRISACPRYGQTYTAPPVTAKDGSDPICPDCGTREALESIGLEILKALGTTAGEITIDEAGVARNCIGRALIDDLLEKLLLVTDKADSAATWAAREDEVEIDLESYRASKKALSAEELAEMRAASGAGTKVVDILTGEEIQIDLLFTPFRANM